MISATLLAIFFVPLFFVLVRRRFPVKRIRQAIRRPPGTDPRDIKAASGEPMLLYFER